MERAKVIFANPDNSSKIIIDLSYDKEKSILDYSINLGNNQDLNKPMDFIGYLASSFLNIFKQEDKK